MGLGPFAVVDVETSGLRPGRHQVLQIGLVTVDRSGTVLGEWSTLVRLRHFWNRVGPTHVHGLTRRSLRGAAPASNWCSIPGCARSTSHGASTPIGRSPTGWPTCAPATACR